MFRVILFYFRLLNRGLRAFSLVWSAGKIVSDRVTGLSIEEVISLWLSIYRPPGYSIVMTDISFSERGIDFWIGMPKEITKKFIFSDVLVLSVKDYRSATTIMDSIHPGFAKASLFKGSNVQYNNVNRD